MTETTPERSGADAARRGGLTRREAVGLVGAGLLAAATPVQAQTNATATLIQTTLGDGKRFAPSAVTDLAREISKKPFVPPSTDLPEGMGGLNYEQYVALKALPSARLWAGENRGFVAEPLLRGFVFNNGVGLYTIEDDQIRRVGFERSHFDLGKLPVPPNADIGFSGFRLTAQQADRPPLDFAFVQGATFFRAIATGQNFGVISRALTLKPAEARGEEFPLFRAFWIERPAPGANALVVHGLVDSESVSGSVRMTFRPGDVTIVDVETTLFPRVNLEHVGLGGMGATFLYGPNVHRGDDDIRPAVYEVSGLQMLNGKGEWLWRPLNNPDNLQISAFVDENPRGFGLLQRQRDLSAFQDDEQRFEARPSLWIEPIGDWGQGAVQLIEIPTDSEVNDNILAYWRPKPPMPGGTEIAFAYRQFWCWSAPNQPPLATVAMTRQGRGSSNRRRRFLVEFRGETLAKAVEGLEADLSSGPGTIAAKRIWSYPDRKAVRVLFELDRGGETVCELRLVLLAGGKPLSETWLYRWTP